MLEKRKTTFKHINDAVVSEQKEMSLYSHKAEKKEDLTVLDTSGFFRLL